MATANTVIGITITGDADDLVAAAKQAQDAVRTLGDRTAATFDRSAKAMAEAAAKQQRQASWQTLQLGQQLQDLGVQIAGGQNPLLALIQQGSQLTAIYGSAGAAMNAAFGALMNPALAAVGAVAALGLALYKGEQQSTAFAKALTLTGNAAGVTEGQFNSMVASISQATEQSALKVRELAQTLLQSGRFGASGLQEMTDLAVRMAALTGKSAEATAQDLVRLADSPAAFAAEQNKQLNFLSAAQLRYIQQLEAFGKREEAVAATREALLSRLPQKVEENLGSLQKATKAVGTWFSDMWDKALAVGREKTIEERIAQLRELAKRDQRPLLGQQDPRRSSNPELEERLNDLLEQRRNAEKAAAGKEAQAAKNRRDIEQRELADRLSGQRFSLANAVAEAQTRERLRQIESDRLVLAAELANAEAPALRSYLEQQLAAKELAALEEKRLSVVRQLAANNARAVNAPGDALDKQQRAVDLSQQLRDIQEAGSKVQFDLQEKLRGLQLRAAVEIAQEEEKRRDAAGQALGRLQEQVLALDELTAAQTLSARLSLESGVAADRLRSAEEYRLMVAREMAAIAQQAQEGRLSQAEQEQAIALRMAALGRLRSQQLRNEAAAEALEQAQRTERRQEAQSDALVAINNQTVALRESAAAQAFENDLVGKSYAATLRLREAREYELRLNQEAAQIAREVAAGNLTAEQASQALAARTGALDALRVEQLRSQVRELGLLYDAQTGVSEAIREYGQTAQQAGQLAREATSRVIGSIEDDLLQTFRTGKLSAKSFIDTLINEFLRLQVIKPLMQNILGGNNGLDFFGRFFGSRSAAAGGINPVSGEYLGSLEFSGGGYTGNAPRSGGLDGQGGFLAMLHPQESVFDHYKGTGVAVGSGGANVTVNIINQSGEQVQTRESTDAGGNRTLEVMIGAVKDSIASDLFARTGSVHRAMKSAMA